MLLPVNLVKVSDDEIVGSFIRDASESYAFAALWASGPDGHGPSVYGIEDISADGWASITADVTDFVMANWPTLGRLDPGAVGHDFLLTRDGHGAGFWDRGLGEIGDALAKAAGAYGESGLYVGDDGMIYVD